MSLRQIRELAKIAEKPARRVIGLMSGTSLDGLDIALCRISGNGISSQLVLEEFTTADYDADFRRSVLEVFSVEKADLQKLTLLNASIGQHHADLINKALQSWSVNSQDVDLIASHGQTIYHAPRSLHGLEGRPNATLQIGDADHIAVQTGIITLSDFRQKHIAAGGEGAPLAAYGDALLFSDEKNSRILLNIGGIANFTYLPSAERDDQAFSSDVGPGNTLMDAYVRQHFAPASYDKDAVIARRGSVNRELLDALLGEPFLAKPLPKTTGPELFSLDRFMATKTIVNASLSHEDCLATLNRFSAETIARSIWPLADVTEVFVSGGGAHNPLLRDHLAELLPDHTIRETSALGLNPDAKEAVLFALLANEMAAGDPQTFVNRIKGAPAISMGKISLPN